MLQIKTKVPVVRSACATLLAALLVACGGGGGGGPGPAPAGVQPPPGAVTVLAGTAGESAAGASAVVDGVAAVAERAGAFSGLGVLLEQPLTVAAASGRERPLLRETAPCGELLSAPCSGSMTLDADIDENATVVPAGTVLDVQFDALSGGFFGVDLSIDGLMSIKFIDTFDLDANVVELNIEVTMTGLRGSVDGTAFGPLNDVAALSLTAQGDTTVTAGGRRYSGLGTLQFNGPGDYSLSGGSIRASFSSGSATYIDITVHNWHVVDGRPQLGSSATVAASNGSMSLRVISSSASEVVYAVSASVAGQPSSYVVTASYPSGGGLPTYTAVPG